MVALNNKWLWILISIRAPARGATNVDVALSADSGFQSALPRGERRLSLEHSTPHIPISIRAPARGATHLT